MNPNPPDPINQQVQVALRIGLTSIGVYFATKFGIDGALVPALVAGLIASLTAAYSMWNSRKAGLLINAAAVKGTTVVASPAMAAITPPHVLSTADVMVVNK
jgi:hypothetical protein